LTKFGPATPTHEYFQDDSSWHKDWLSSQVSKTEMNIKAML